MLTLRIAGHFCRQGGIVNHPANGSQATISFSTLVLSPWRSALTPTPLSIVSQALQSGVSFGTTMFSPSFSPAPLSVSRVGQLKSWWPERMLLPYAKATLSNRLLPSASMVAFRFFLHLSDFLDDNTIANEICWIGSRLRLCGFLDVYLHVRRWAHP